jgi:hypothetical protein
MVAVRGDGSSVVGPIPTAPGARNGGGAAGLVRVVPREGKEHRPGKEGALQVARSWYRATRRGLTRSHPNPNVFRNTFLLMNSLFPCALANKSFIQ